MARTQALEAALAAWREAERQLVLGADGEVVALQRNVDFQRDEYQRLSTASMLVHLDKLHEAEGRRARARPSTSPFHEAARDTQEIAADIWEAARSGDEDTPGAKRHPPRPSAPGGE